MHLTTPCYNVNNELILTTGSVNDIETILPMSAGRFGFLLVVTKKKKIDSIFSVLDGIEFRIKRKYDAANNIFSALDGYIN